MVERDGGGILPEPELPLCRQCAADGIRGGEVGGREECHDLGELDLGELAVCVDQAARLEMRCPWFWCQCVSTCYLDGRL